MRVALIEELGAAPVTGERPEPAPGGGEVVLDVLATALNPVDLAIAGGTFYAGHPPLPFVPGIEAVGRPRDDGGRLVYVQGGGRGIGADGFAAERIAVPEELTIDIPPGSDPALAVALGTAGLAGWLSVTWRGEAREGDVVVVLGATGSVGQVALQAARASGAERVVAVGRSPERLARVSALADEVVALGEGYAGELAEACGRPPTLVIDMLWGEPAAAAMGACAIGARFVQVGASAAPAATIPSASVRGKQLDVRGYSNFGVPRDELAAAYRALVERAGDGGITLELERFALDDAAAAWAAAAEGRTKAVICPAGPEGGR